MSRKSNGIKLEHGIWYYEKADTYIIRGQSGKTYGFPTFDDAKKFYEELKQSKLNTKLLEERERVRKLDEKIIAKAMPYPFNVIKDAGLSDSDILTIEEARINLMSARDRGFFDQYYKEDKSLKEIAYEAGVTKVRIGQVIKRCLKLIVYAKNKRAIIEKNDLMREQIAKDNAEISAYRKQIVEIFRETGVYSKDMVIEFGPVQVKRRQGKHDLLDKPIDELNLSVRARNCLRRAGIHKVDQLVERTPEDIGRIKSLGSKSFKEILDKVHEVGLTLKGE